MTKNEELPESSYIRAKLHEPDKSLYEKYSELTIGSVSIRRLVVYEVITLFFSQIPGALGLLLRKIFYPRLVAETGPGVVFGRNVTIRNGNAIFIRRGTMIDDDCVLDARGADEGVTIGREVILNRGVHVQAKHGAITIGDNTDIGAGSIITSQGRTLIGRMVSVGSGCKIGGGGVALGDIGDLGEGEATNRFADRGQKRVSKGPVVVEDGCIFGRNVIVQDGVVVGRGSVVGSGAILRESVPAESVVIPQVRNLVVPRDRFSGEHAPRDGSYVEKGAAPPPSLDRARAETDDAVEQAVFAAIDEVNELLPVDSRLSKERDAPLIEPNGPLDSLGLVNFAVALETQLSNKVRTNIDLLSLPPESRIFISVQSVIEGVKARLAPPRETGDTPPRSRTATE